MVATTERLNPDLVNADIIDASGGEGVGLPIGFAPSDMDFTRDGHDLVLVNAEGKTLIIRDYFNNISRPALITPEGITIPGDVAALLAGPQAPAMLAQAEGVLAGDVAGDMLGEPIGEIDMSSGLVIVERLDGTRSEVGPGMALYRGDVIETGQDGAVGIVLADETTLAMDSSGRMVLDEFVYDPVGETGHMSMFLMNGVYTVVSGMISKLEPDGMIIDTPVGSIGIRGTQLGIDLRDGKHMSAVLMREADGFVGEVVVSNSLGMLVMNQANQGIVVGTSSDAPAHIPRLDDGEIADWFGGSLAFLPTRVDVGNDYGAQQGGAEVLPGELEPDELAPDEPVPEQSESDNIPESEASPEIAPLESIGTIIPQVPQGGETEPDGEPLPVDTQRHMEDDVLGVAPNYDPIAFDETQSTNEELALEGQLQASDADDTDLTYTIAEAGAPLNGSLTVNTDGSYTYTPDAEFSGTDAFTYQVSDGRGGQTTATVSLVINPVAEAPELGVSDVSVGGVGGDEVIVGSGHDETLYGGGGSDTITGAGGDDIIYGDMAAPGGGEGEYDVLNVPLDIEASIADVDTESVLGISISGVPDGAVLSAGEPGGEGVWNLDGVDLEGLTVQLPEGFHENFQLQVSAVETETSAELDVSDTASTSATINVTYGGGEAGDDKLYGGGGDDTLYGGGGDDLLRGQGGDDVLHGGAGADELRGEGGKDILAGGPGDDTLRGGGGEDAFVFAADGGSDFIEDYRSGEMIRFEGPEFSGSEPEMVNHDQGTTIMFGAQNVDVTLNDVDLSQQSYTITQEPDAIIVVFDEVD